MSHDNALQPTSVPLRRHSGAAVPTHLSSDIRPTWEHGDSGMFCKVQAALARRRNISRIIATSTRVSLV